MAFTTTLLRKAGLTSVAAATYGTVVYFTYQFMTANAEKNKQALVNDPKSYSPCSCVCSSSITDPERTKTFSKIARVYDDQISRDELAMGLPLLRRALLYFNATGKTLEVGAGTGRNLDYYPQNVDSVILTDSSDQMLLQAREKLKNHPSKNKFRLFVADAENITKFYPDNSFDTIVDTFGLCSFDDPVAVLIELQRVCKKDGKILLLEHGRSKTWQGLTNYLDKHAERHASNWGCVWNRDLDRIISDSGLEIEHIDTWHFGTTYYAICKPSEKYKYTKPAVKEYIKDSGLKGDSRLKMMWKSLRRRLGTK